MEAETVFKYSVKEQLYKAQVVIDDSVIHNERNDYHAINNIPV